jgi:hypothetical protein
MEHFKIDQAEIEGHIQLNTMKIIGQLKSFLPTNGISLQEYSDWLGLPSEYVLACIDNPNDWNLLHDDDKLPYICMHIFLAKFKEDEEEGDELEEGEIREGNGQEDELEGEEDLKEDEEEDGQEDEPEREDGQEEDEEDAKNEEDELEEGEIRDDSGQEEEDEEDEEDKYTVEAILGKRVYKNGQEKYWVFLYYKILIIKIQSR